MGIRDRINDTEKARRARDLAASEAAAAAEVSALRLRSTAWELCGNMAQETLELVSAKPARYKLTVTGVPKGPVRWFLRERGNPNTGLDGHRAMTLRRVRAIRLDTNTPSEGNVTGGTFLVLPDQVFRGSFYADEFKVAAGSAPQGWTDHVLDMVLARWRYSVVQASDGQWVAHQPSGDDAAALRRDWADWLEPLVESELTSWVLH